MGCHTQLHAQNRGAEAKREARQHAEQKADRHMVTTIHTVRQQTIHKTREAVDKTYDGHNNTEAGVRDTVLGRQTGDGEREVLTHEVE